MQGWWIYEIPDAQVAFDAVLAVEARYTPDEITGLAIISREGSESVNQSPTTGERAGEGAVIAARHEWLRSGRVDRRADGQSDEDQGVGLHVRSIGPPVPVHQVAVAVAAARRTTARMRLWARANQSRIARAFSSPRTPMWRRPRLRAMALTHSAVAARSR